MCGIAGIVHRNPSSVQDQVTRMTGDLVHRGPDSGQVAAFGEAVLGHRRLSILDLTDASSQPMRSSDGRYVLVFNGEIYNFRDLRSQLISSGSQFVTDGDTEVLLQSLVVWGESALPRLIGMFAFAFWDSVEQRLLCARDRYGEKPFFYSLLDDGGIAFCSEPEPLRRHVVGPSEPSPVGLGQFLSLGYTLGTSTLHPRITRLPHGSSLVFRIGDSPVVKRWTGAPSRVCDEDSTSSPEGDVRLLDVLDGCVHDQLVSDVPVGVLLSGGLDSAAIASGLVNCTQDSGGSGQVPSFTIGFSDSAFDESNVAKMTARHLGITPNVRVIEMSDDDRFKALERASEEPIADSSFIPTWALARFAREEVTVVLSGDGGDEFLGGYPTYVANKIHNYGSRLPRFARDFFRYLAYNAVPVTHGKVGFDYKVRQLADGLHLDPCAAHHSWRRFFSDAQLRRLLHPAVYDEVRDHSGLEEFTLAWDAASDMPPLERAMFVDRETWMANDILVKVDRSSMSHGLECRAPMLHPAFTSYCSKLPVKEKLDFMTGKPVLRRELSSRIPRDILRLPKRGFNAPVSTWFAGSGAPFLKDRLLSPTLRTWCRQNAISDMIEEHLSMRADHGLRLLALYILSSWLDPGKP